MSKNYKVLQPDDVKVSLLKHEFAVDVLHGLSQSIKHLPSKYIYDNVGSVLFQKIMDLPEYYLTNCEKEVLDTHKTQLVSLIGQEEFNLVELGAGDGLKTKILIDEFMNKKLDFHYVPIDISELAIKDLVQNVSHEFKNLKTEGIVAEYFYGLKWLSKLNHRKNLVLFLGSNIGNFNSSEAKVFLTSLWNSLNDGDLILIGFDLKKDINIIAKAYNDSKGVTAQFNYNLLHRINKELKGNFEIEQFQFYSSYHIFSGAIISSLISKIKQQVYIKDLNRLFSFDEWEPIHTESSHKYNIQDIDNLAEDIGFEMSGLFYDSKKFFVDCLWRVSKD